MKKHFDVFTIIGNGTSYTLGCFKTLKEAREYKEKIKAGKVFRAYGTIRPITKNTIFIIDEWINGTPVKEYHK